MCTVSVSWPDSSYYENWPGPNLIPRVCFNRNGTLSTNLVEDGGILLSSFRGEVGNVSVRYWDIHLGFCIGTKNTNSVENVGILLYVKFPVILIRIFREEVKNVSANQSLWWQSLFSYPPEKHKLGRGRWLLAFVYNFIKFDTAFSEK